MVGPAKNVVFGQIAHFCNYLIPPYLPLPEIGVPLATLSCWRTQQMVKKHTQLVPILCVTKISTLYRQQVITGLEKHHVWLHIACFGLHKNSWKSPLKNTPCYMAKKKTPEDGTPSREKCPPWNVWKHPHGVDQHHLPSTSKCGSQLIYI